MNTPPGMYSLLSSGILLCTILVHLHPHQGSPRIQGIYCQEVELLLPNTWASLIMPDSTMEQLTQQGLLEPGGWPEWPTSQLKPLFFFWHKLLSSQAFPTVHVAFISIVNVDMTSLTPELIWTLGHLFNQQTQHHYTHLAGYETEFYYFKGLPLFYFWYWWHTAG